MINNPEEEVETSDNSHQPGNEPPPDAANGMPRFNDLANFQPQNQSPTLQPPDNSNKFIVVLKAFKTALPLE
jgi:hypothetical protein